MISDLGLDYNICKASRWKEFSQVESESSEHAKYDHKVPAKILRHFPLIPRFQRLFMCSKTAKEMRWHEGRSKDGKLRHPADGQA
ncbi:unnamed protein product [Lathyrus sativus]|nr:unnamed protein product [Lathyrus sativus]